MERFFRLALLLLLMSLRFHSIILVVALLVEVAIECRDRKGNDDSEFNDHDREVSGSFFLNIIDYPTLFGHIIDFPTIKPAIESFNRALVVPAERNFPILSVISQFHGKCIVAVLVHLKN